MKPNRLVLILFMLTISGPFLAQTNFQPGYIINNTSDTIHGYIDNRSEIRNMRVCEFRTTENSETIEYFPGDIQGYRFNTGKYFISKHLQTKNINDTVFVEFLLKGINNLYFYIKPNFNAYYLESEKTGLVELEENEVEIEKDGQVYLAKQKRYIGWLTYAFSDCKEILEEINKTNLNHKNLIQISKKYHDYVCTDEACIIYEKKLSVLRIEIKPLIGLAISDISYRNTLFDQVKFQQSAAPTLGVGFNIFIPRFNDKFSLQTNLAFRKDYFYGEEVLTHELNTRKANYYHIHNTNMQLSLGLKYTYPKGRFRPEFQVGAFDIIPLKNRITHYEEVNYLNTINTSKHNYEVFSSNQFGLFGAIGVEYKVYKNLKLFNNIMYGSAFELSRIIETQSYKSCVQLSIGLIL